MLVLLPGELVHRLRAASRKKGQGSLCQVLRITQGSAVESWLPQPAGSRAEVGRETAATIPELHGSLNGGSGPICEAPETTKRHDVGGAEGVI